MKARVILGKPELERMAQGNPLLVKILRPGTTFEDLISTLRK